jgi:anti-anti-sigma regulatory factor
MKPTSATGGWAAFQGGPTTAPNNAEDRPFQITRGCLTLLLPEDLGHHHIERLTGSILPHLSEHSRVASVVFDCTHLCLIDPTDLAELMGLVQTIGLMGKGVGFCSISPGLAALMIDLDLPQNRAIFGRDLDDAIARLADADPGHGSTKPLASK